MGIPSLGTVYDREVWEGGGFKTTQSLVNFYPNKKKVGEELKKAMLEGGTESFEVVITQALEGSVCKTFPPLKGVSLERLVHHLSTDPLMIVF